MTGHGMRMEADQLDPSVIVITFERTHSGNALNRQMVLALERSFRAVAANPGARVMVLLAEGRHFCVGGDLDEFAALARADHAERRRAIGDLLDCAAAMIEALDAIPQPVVVACNGTVAGGGVGLLLAADLAFGDPGTVLRFSHGTIGVPPDGGVSWLLPRAVGPRRAADLVLREANVAADEAMALGLLTAIAPSGGADALALRRARQIAAAAPAAARGAKALLRAAEGQPLSVHLRAERDRVVDAVAAEDFPGRLRRLLDRYV